MAAVKVEIRGNGPRRIIGELEIGAQSGNYTIPEGQWVSFCRCGQSDNKPFCDGTHRDCGFEAASEAR